MLLALISLCTILKCESSCRYWIPLAMPRIIWDRVLQFRNWSLFPVVQTVISISIIILSSYIIVILEILRFRENSVKVISEAESFCSMAVLRYNRDLSCRIWQSLCRSYHRLWDPNSCSSCIHIQAVFDLRLNSNLQGEPGSCVVCLWSSSPLQETPTLLAGIFL